MAGKYLDQEGLAYFWEQIKLSPEGKSVITVDTMYDFPTVGKPDILYVAKTENTIYRWDDVGIKYEIVGSNYNEIEQINGGKA